MSKTTLLKPIWRLRYTICFRLH